MNATELLAMYERVADSPDAVGKLRMFVLDLAVRGRLVEQSTADEPAAKLLHRIDRGRTILRKFETVEAQEFYTPLSHLPAGWAWTTVDCLASDAESAITDGPFGSELKTSHYIEHSEFRVIRLQNIGTEGFRDEHRSYVDEDRFNRLRKHQVQPGDLVVAGLVDPRLRCCQVPADIGMALVKADCYRFAVHNFVVSGYLLRYLNSPWAQNFAVVHHHGMTLTRIGLGNFRRIPVPLPPFAEQQRIVAKVDELMALCDQLEAGRTEREAKRDRFAAASLARLNAPDPDKFQMDVRFALNVLPSLSARRDQVKQLRQTILNLAVRGKLVPQDPSDEPATKLLTRLATSAPAVAEVNRAVPFESPAGWHWATMRHLVLQSDAGWSPKTEDHPRTGNAWGVLKVSAVSWGAFQSSENKEVLPGTQPRLQAQVQRGDFLISRANTAELVARSVIVEEDPVNLMMSDKIVRLRLSSAVDPQFICILNNSANFAREHYARLASGVSPSMKNVSRDVILDLPVPVPPAGEQQRIVAKVRVLMMLCDHLEASLAARDSTCSRLLDALLHEVLEPPRSAAASCSLFTEDETGGVRCR